MTGARSRPGCADFVVLALFLAVPLAASPRFPDQFTTVKWLVLEALAVAWFLTEVWRCGGRGWPAFVRERWPAGLLLVALPLLGGWRSGLAWAAPALLDRLSFVLLALAAYWYFRRNGGRTGFVVLGAGVAAGCVVLWALGQTLGWQPFPSLSAGDQRSASFGNVNMTAQFLGFAVILLLAGPEDGCRGRARSALRTALVVATFVSLYFLSCRSVFLALGAGLTVLLATRRLSAGSLTRMLGAATVLVLLLLRYGPVGLPHFLSPRVQADKALSVQMRLEVWKSTLGLIGDHPLGVGSGNFGDAFIPYQLGVGLISGELVLFRTPHNEYLRVLAEEGMVFGAVAAVLLISLGGQLSGCPRLARWRSGPGPLLGAGAALLAVEAFFQFPFGTAFGCLAAAVLLGLAFAVLEPGAPSAATGRLHLGSRWLWRGPGTLVAATALVLLGRVVASDLLLASHPGEATALEAACRLNPRNLPACVTAAWLRARVGDEQQARRLLHETLQRSPYYHPAIRLLGETAAAAGHREEACLYLWIYDELFRGRSPVHPAVLNFCGGVRPAGLPRGFTMPHYRKLPVVLPTSAGSMSESSQGLESELEASLGKKGAGKGLDACPGKTGLGIGRPD